MKFVKFFDFSIFISQVQSIMRFFHAHIENATIDVTKRNERERCGADSLNKTNPSREINDDVATDRKEAD